VAYGNKKLAEGARQQKEEKDIYIYILLAQKKTSVALVR
jgi:hypothetical protein